MIEKLRVKWCEDLEELLQCPICMSRPKIFVYQCVQGHHICNACKVRLPRCPICTQNWSSTRNRLAENLCAKLDEIKLSLMDPEDESNKVLIPERVSMSTQTDEKSDALPVTINSNSDHRGSYPCRIGACGTHQHYESMNMHLRMKHKQQFLEMQCNGPVFEHTFLFKFFELVTFDRAVCIPNMGTFFVKLAIDVHGNFNGSLMMVHHRLIAKRYTYQMQISSYSGKESSTYTGNVWSCRIPTMLLFEKGMTISYSAMKKMANQHIDQQLKCKVILSKKDPNPVLDQKSEGRT